eukprot:6190443-Pleurochrysis_carterae.AAC.4
MRARLAAARPRARSIALTLRVAEVNNCAVVLEEVHLNEKDARNLQTRPAHTTQQLSQCRRSGSGSQTRNGGDGGGGESPPTGSRWKAHLKEELPGWSRPPVNTPHRQDTASATRPAFTSSIAGMLFTPSLFSVFCRRLSSVVVVL